MENYPGLNFNKEELSSAMTEGYARIISFITTPQFKKLYEELVSLPREDRPAFVTNTIMQPSELAKRNIAAPDDIMIQLSAFGDRRPTLFAVKTWLPSKFKDTCWENVNYTFDNEFDDDSVTRVADEVWRAPLPVSRQIDLLSRGQSLESVS